MSLYILWLLSYSYSYHVINDKNNIQQTLIDNVPNKIPIESNPMGQWLYSDEDDISADSLPTLSHLPPHTLEAIITSEGKILFTTPSGLPTGTHWYVSMTSEGQGKNVQITRRKIQISDSPSPPSPPEVPIGAPRRPPSPPRSPRPSFPPFFPDLTITEYVPYRTWYHRLHAFSALFTVGVLFPFNIVLIRLFPIPFRVRKYAHGALQLAGVAFIWSTVIILYREIGYYETSDDLRTLHINWGITVLTLGVFLVLLTRIPRFKHWHKPVGRIIILGFAINVILGVHLYDDFTVYVMGYTALGFTIVTMWIGYLRRDS